MNKSFSSSTPPTPPNRPTSAVRLTPAVIPLDYNYSIMSPSTLYTRTMRRPSIYRHRDSTDAETLENHYSSIFGDPVPPPPPVEFYDIENKQLFPRLLMDGSSEEDAKFSGLNSAMSRRFDSSPASSRARLQPPDIQILPNSSEGSSSDHLGSPNFTLLRPTDIMMKPALYENINATDVHEIIETITMEDATSVKEYSEAKRRVSNFSDDFRSNVGTFCQSRVSETSDVSKSLLRRDSNESYSSEDWFRPTMRDFTEFSKIPKLRPSSKNVMSIKSNEMPKQFSPVAAMFTDSSGSDVGVPECKDENQEVVNMTEDLPPVRPPVPSPKTMLALQNDEVTQRPRSISENKDTNFIRETSIAPPTRPATALSLENETMKQNISPAIKTNLIATGGDHRFFFK